MRPTGSDQAQEGEVGVSATPPQEPPNAPATGGALVEVDIERLDEAAAGVGATREGQAASVVGTLPGETVKLRIVRVSRQTGHLYGALQEITRASPDRVPSPCPNFLRCGGCDLLHASMDAQHRFKTEKVAAALAALGVVVSDIEPAPADVGYRALAKFVVGADGTLGSYAPYSHDVVSMSGCVVHAPEIEGVAESIRAWLTQRPPPFDLRYVLMRASTWTRNVAVTLVSRGDEADGLAPLLERLKTDVRVARIAFHANPSEGDSLLGRGPIRTAFARGPHEERLGDIVHHIAEGAFSQVNPTATARAYKIVSRLAAPKGARILDLYAGSGGISLRLLADGAAHVVAVESSAAAIEAARTAAKANGLSGGLAGLYAEPVEAFLDRLRRPEEPCAVQCVGLNADFDVVIANPPRKGLSPPVLNGLTSLGWDRLVYMSCNPSSLARDLEELIRLDSRIRIEGAYPVDLFPQTKHVETVVLVARDSVPRDRPGVRKPDPQGRSVRSLHAPRMALDPKIVPHKP